MRKNPPRLLFALLLAIALHLSLFLLWTSYERFVFVKAKDKNLNIIEVHFEDPIAKKNSELITSLISDRQPESLVAPSAPTAEEWAFASTYTLKNSKGYRHTWGKQVRSMMGAAVEGVDQGQVRFRIEIAPNGSISKVETLWKTSDKAESLARKAMYSMPPPPPTPTGKPLIFEKTISFSPFATDDTPIYRDDCLPDPPAFTNPFAWDGKSPQVMKQNKPPEKLSPEALAECLKQLPQESLEGLAASDQRLITQGRSSAITEFK